MTPATHLLQVSDLARQAANRAADGDLTGAWILLKQIPFKLKAAEAELSLRMDTGDLVFEPHASGTLEQPAKNWATEAIAIIEEKI